MSSYGYPPAVIAGDIARTLLGSTVAAVPLLFGEPSAPLALLLLGLIAGFLGLGVASLYRHLGRTDCDGTGLVVNGRRVSWSELSRLRLAYFSTRRDGENGWFQLTLEGGGRRVSIESSLPHFHDILLAATRAATARSLALDAASRANLAALAIPLPPGAR